MADNHKPHRFVVQGMVDLSREIAPFHRSGSRKGVPAHPHSVGNATSRPEFAPYAFPSDAGVHLPPDIPDVPTPEELEAAISEGHELEKTEPGRGSVPLRKLLRGRYREVTNPETTDELADVIYGRRWEALRAAREDRAPRFGVILKNRAVSAKIQADTMAQLRCLQETMQSAFGFQVTLSNAIEALMFMAVGLKEKLGGKPSAAGLEAKGCFWQDMACVRHGLDMEGYLRCLPRPGRKPKPENLYRGLRYRGLRYRGQTSRASRFQPPERRIGIDTWEQARLAAEQEANREWTYAEKRKWLREEVDRRERGLQPRPQPFEPFV